jgi:hypothetical protein
MPKSMKLGSKTTTKAAKKGSHGVAEVPYDSPRINYNTGNDKKGLLTESFFDLGAQLIVVSHPTENNFPHDSPAEIPADFP